MQLFDWNLPFKIIYDTNDYAVEVVSGQRRDKKAYAIYYTSYTLNETQINYVITKK